MAVYGNLLGVGAVILMILGEFWVEWRSDFRLKMGILSNSVSNSFWGILGEFLDGEVRVRDEV